MPLPFIAAIGAALAKAAPMIGKAAMAAGKAAAPALKAGAKTMTINAMGQLGKNMFAPNAQAAMMDPTMMGGFQAGGMPSPIASLSQPNSGGMRPSAPTPGGTPPINPMPFDNFDTNMSGLSGEDRFLRMLLKRRGGL